MRAATPFIQHVLDNGRIARKEARVALVAGRFLLSPDARSLRLVHADDETAQYLQIWLRRITGTAVFGYFGLQSAQLLGLKHVLYQPLLQRLPGADWAELSEMLEEPVTPVGNEIFVKREYYKLVPRPTLLKGVVYDPAPLRDGDLAFGVAARRDRDRA